MVINRKMNAAIMTKLSEYFDIAAIEKINREASDKKDVLSTIYEEISDVQKRKKLAQFFTHKELVNFLVDNVPITKKSLILDPACGAGAFLIAVLEKNGLRSENIFGIDVDSTALALCSLNMEMNIGKNKFNLIQTDTIGKFNLQEYLPEVAIAGGFDVIIGNPPFKNMNKDIGYNSKEPMYNSIINGVANSATLMIGKSYSLLKEGGYLGFVLPKNILRVDSFSNLRKFLLKNTKILTIYDLGHYFKDVRGDQIILIFQKQSLSKSEQLSNLINVLIKKKETPFSNPYQYKLTQKAFSDFERFPIFYNKEIYHLAKKLLLIKDTLNSISKGRIFRGISLAGNNPAIFKKYFNGSITVYRGDSICRFGIKYPLFLNPSVLKDLDLSKVNRLSTKKIIIQNITSREGGIFAALSNQDELNLDTVTNIVIDDDLQRKYVLGLLNSRVANFFIIMIIFLHSNFTMHTDRKYIGMLPVIIPEDKKIAECVSIVNRLISIENKISAEYFQVYEKLNRKLYEIYQFNSDEIQLIENCLKEIMSRKQYG